MKLSKAWIEGIVCVSVIGMSIAIGYLSGMNKQIPEEHVIKLEQGVDVPYKIKHGEGIRVIEYEMLDTSINVTLHIDTLGDVTLELNPLNLAENIKVISLSPCQESKYLFNINADKIKEKIESENKERNKNV